MICFFYGFVVIFSSIVGICGDKSKERLCDEYRCKNKNSSVGFWYYYGFCFMRFFWKFF